MADEIINIVYAAAKSKGITGAKMRSLNPLDVVALGGKDWPAVKTESPGPDAWCVLNQVANLLEIEEGQAKDAIKSEVVSLIDSGVVKATDSKTGIVTLTPKAKAVTP